MTRLVLVTLLFCACADPRPEIVALQKQHDALQAEVMGLYTDIANAREARDVARVELTRLRSDVNVLRAISEGKRVRYVLRVKLSQSHFSLNLRQHLADHINAETFDIFTDRQSYEASREGAPLFHAFRTASAFLLGSWGSWKLDVVAKYTLTEPDK